MLRKLFCFLFGHKHWSPWAYEGGKGLDAIYKRRFTPYFCWRCGWTRKTSGPDKKGKS